MAEVFGDQGLASSDLSVNAIIPDGRGSNLYRSVRRAAFNTYTGHAVFLGPTFFLKLSEKASLNETIALQIAGRNISTPGQRFDLDNFTRMMTRVKLALEF